MQFKILLSVFMCLLVQDSATLQISQGSSINEKLREQVKEGTKEKALAQVSGAKSDNITKQLSDGLASIQAGQNDATLLSTVATMTALQNLDTSLVTANQTLAAVLASLNQQNISFSTIATLIQESMGNLTTSQQNNQAAKKTLDSLNQQVNLVQADLSNAKSSITYAQSNYATETSFLFNIFIQPTGTIIAQNEGWRLRYYLANGLSNLQNCQFSVSQCMSSAQTWITYSISSFKLITDTLSDYY